MSPSINPAMTVRLNGVVALDASAGTGKTYSIALIHLRLVLSGVGVDRILVTTFTEAAASELRERLRKRLADARDVLAGEATKDDDLLAVLESAAKDFGGKDKLRNRVEAALSCFDLAPICTIHGFCHRLLRDYALELGADPEGEIGSDDPRIARLVGDYEARMAEGGDAGGESAAKPDGTTCASIAGTIREYDLKLPPQATLDQMLAKWRVTAEETLESAKADWAKQKDSISGEIQALVNDGKITAGVFDNAGAAEASRWRKLTNSVEDATELVSDTKARDLKFSTGAGRLFPDALRNSATESGSHAVDALLARHSFFRHWQDLSLLATRKKNVCARSYLNELLKLAGELKPDRNLIFSDLINSVFRNLENATFVGTVRDSLDAVLVDECQDTDGRQISIFRRLFSDEAWLREKCLVWVGDPKQSIYRFRGADIDTYIDARAGAGKNITLDVNFRSDPPVVAAINALFNGPGKPAASMFGRDIGFTPSSSTKEVRIRSGGSAQPPAFCLHGWKSGDEVSSKNKMLWPVLRDCAEQIRNLLDSGLEIQDDEGRWNRVRASDIAVLTSRHKDLVTVRRDLRAHGIASAYRTDSSVFLEDAARDLQLLLKALASPRPDSLRSVLLTPFFGYLMAEVAGLSDAELDRHQAYLAGLAERLKGEGFMSILSALLRDATGGRPSVLERLAADPEGERTLTNIIQLGELLQQAWMDSHVRSPEALKDYLDQAVAQAGQNAGAESGEESKLRLETDSPAVVLSTIYSAKGLQYPIVCLPLVWAQAAARTPSFIVSRKATGEISLVLPGDPLWEEKLPGEQACLEAEQMRLLYVACTRAKHQVHAWWGGAKSSAWNVASTNTAFGRLLLQERRDADSYLDDECFTAFESAMKRGEGATFEISWLGQQPAWAAPAKRQSAGKATDQKDGERLAAAEWTREYLSAAPLQASYSSLLRRNPEAHRGDDEPALAADGGEESLVAAPADEPVVDVLEPFRAGKVLGDRVHCALEAAMSAGSVEQAGKSFREILAPDLHLLLRGGTAADGAESPQGGGKAQKVETDCDKIAGLLWEQTAGALIGDEKAALASLLAEPHAPEWRFLLPQKASLDPVSLAAAMKEYGKGSPWGGEAYTDRVKRLDFLPLQGYFEGIVDVLGRLPGAGKRWVVIDYKTNRLDDGYAAGHLNHAMAGCHYLLQALLYSVAVKRWLEKSIAGWEYGRHFAGTAYMFLRGLKKGSSQGVWFDRPALELVEAVDRLLCGEGGRQ
ncbi:MAG: UvrD-helicase domain-containing protein [bacterium]